MSKKTDSRVYLYSILESIALIQGYISDLSFEAYDESTQVQDAVHMRLQVIGENAARIPSELLDTYPDVDWKKVIGLRHIISHSYQDLITDRIWKLMEENLPTLETVCKRMLAELDKDSG